MSSSRYVVDTSVIVERILSSSPFKERVEVLFDDARRGGVSLYVTLLTLSEVLYIASKIYALAGVEDPNREAVLLTLWLTSRARIVQPTEDTALRAGELKKTLGLALVDCYAIAAAEQLRCKALFLKPEKEMWRKKELIKQLPIEFLAKNKEAEG
ncbi:MAG: PIN domain-containing protein [Thermofilaceae archaeon]